MDKDRDITNKFRKVIKLPATQIPNITIVNSKWKHCLSNTRFLWKKLKPILVKNMVVVFTKKTALKTGLRKFLLPATNAGLIGYPNAASIRIEIMKDEIVVVINNFISS